MAKDRYDARYLKMVRDDRQLVEFCNQCSDEAIRRFPPSKKVLDERRPPAPWILLTDDPEPSPAPTEEGNGGV